MPAQTTTTVTTTAVTTEAPPPVKSYGDDFVRCNAAICYDLTDGKVIYSKNAGKKVFPASTTKILTALTAIEYTAPEYEYYVGSELGLVAQDSSMSWIAEGSSLCRNEILTAMLAPSGNDAAYTIAVNVARKLYGDDISDNDAVAYFAVLMNDYAKKLGAKNTHFTVPDGYHDDEHYTTAEDMLQFAIAATQSRTICDITCQPLAIVYDEQGNVHSWDNGNKLLTDTTIPYEVYGMKTGFTDEAGFCFIGYAGMNGKKTEFVGKDEALCFSTGFTVNEGIIPAVVGRGDYIICDDRDHASIVDGRRLSFATQLKYKHNDMEDLEKELQKCEPDAVKLIIVDGVFSMEGDLANLPEIVRLKKKYNASIYVDEAHGLGVFGKQGRGVCDHFGVTEDIDLIMGTFSKSLASIGGFIAGDKEVINWLRHNARSYIFQASSTPAATAAAREALHIIKSEPERIQRLWDITNYALKSFRDAGFEIGETESPIIPLYVRDTEKTFVVTKMAFDEGIFINPVIPPACAPQDTLVRVALMATHTKEQVDYAVEKLTKCFRELGIIK